MSAPPTDHQQATRAQRGARRARLDVSPKNYQGAGIEWHPALWDDIRRDTPPFVEIIAENFFFRNEQVLQELADRRIPVLVHCVELSLGSAEGISPEHLERVKQVGQRLNTVNYSDHVGWCRAGGWETVQPAILPWNLDAAQVVARNVKMIQDSLQHRFLIENEANRYQFPDPEMSEPSFFNEIIERSGCGLLLDLTNLYTNQINFGTDAKAWLDEVNLSAVETLHIAGGSYDHDGDLVDSHDRAVPAEVWELLAYIAPHINPVTVILERNGRFPKYSELKGELNKADQILISAVQNGTERDAETRPQHEFS